jgi:hypothetical protein
MVWVLNCAGVGGTGGGAGETPGCVVRDGITISREHDEHRTVRPPISSLTTYFLPHVHANLIDIDPLLSRCP